MDRPAGSACLLTFFLLVGCGAGDGAPTVAPSEPGLARYPEAEAQIVAYYASQGSGEPQHNCGRGRIARIEGSRIHADRPVEVIFEVAYRFEASGPGGLPCDGIGRRWFIFDREADGRLLLAEMSDQAP